MVGKQVKEVVSEKVLKLCDAMKDCIAFFLNERASERLASECYWALAPIDELIQVSPNTVVICVSE